MAHKMELLLLPYRHHNVTYVTLSAMVRPRSGPLSVLNPHHPEGFASCPRSCRGAFYLILLVQLLRLIVRIQLRHALEPQRDKAALANIHRRAVLVLASRGVP